jgi:hypothetical protein
MTASAAASPPVASSSSPTSATLAGAVSRLLPDAWASALGGGGHGRRAGAASGRKPRVVPLKFQTHHVRKQYRLKRAAPTWAEWFGARKSTLLVAGGVLLLALVLYLKWQDAQARRAAEKNRATSLQSLPPTTTPSPPPPSLVPVVSSGPYY